MEIFLGTEYLAVQDICSAVSDLSDCWALVMLIVNFSFKLSDKLK